MPSAVGWRSFDFSVSISSIALRSILSFVGETLLKWESIAGIGIKILENLGLTEWIMARCMDWDSWGENGFECVAGKEHCVNLRFVKCSVDVGGRSVVALASLLSVAALSKQKSKDRTRISLNDVPTKYLRAEYYFKTSNSHRKYQSNTLRSEIQRQLCVLGP